MTKSVSRLFTQFQPSRYDVTFDLDEKVLRFSGQLILSGKKVGRPSQRITLHQHGLKITAASIVKHDKKGDQAMVVSRINNQASLDEVRLHCDTMLYPGEYTLTVSFEAPITSGMTGIYPCYFKDGDQEKFLLATQFESHHAREAFPCIDEPEAKAVFAMTLVTRSGVQTLGNTPVASQAEAAGRLTTSFEPTPKMSSYLLAFVVGDLHRKTTATKRGTEVNVWGTVAQPADSFDFALDVARRAIEFFEDYFDTPYPLPKADHVALPDFSSGAMENWGLITYRERILLAYPGETAQSVLEQIATVITHETSHQWFGNLVTMKWWNDLWLNESFANMMEYEAVDAQFPEWQIWNSFIAGEGLSAFRRDAVAGVQAVKTDVHHPDEISSLFDPSIVYAKGGRLLYMLKNYVGEAAFRDGLKAYFAKHAFGNTEGQDLWNALSTSSGKDIAAFMDPWLTRSGFPLLTVGIEGETVTVRQQQFSDDPRQADPDRFWPVPLFASQPGLPDAFTAPEITFTSPDPNELVINGGAKGHYLVRYQAAAHRQSILAKVRDQSLSEADRLMLLNGGSMLARAGYEPYANVLTMLAAYAGEASEPVWDIMALVLGESRRFIDQDETLEAPIKTFIGKLIKTQYQRLGWDGPADEGAADHKLRALILGLGVYADQAEVIGKASQLFAAHHSNAAALPPELRALIYLVPVKNGDQAAFDYLLQLHDSTQNSDLKGDVCDALTAIRDPQQASLLLTRLKDARLVKPQDVDRWLVYLLRNRYVRDTAWNWMVTNWPWLEATFQNDKSYDYLPRYAASIVNSRDYERKYRELFAGKTDQLLLKRNIEMGLAEIATRLDWLERDLASVRDFFTAA